MHCFLLIGLLYFASCSGQDENMRKQSPPSENRTTGTSDTRPPTPPPPPAVRDNLTMMGAEVTSIKLTGDFDFELGLLLQTALPAGTGPTIAEPGQRIVVRPAFMLDESGRVAENDRNKRLFAVRGLKVGEAVIGRIGMQQDGMWYLIDTGLE